jgi:hypothetical protein
MQKWLLNITVILLLFLSLSAYAQNEVLLLKRADSLYSKKKYSEAQRIYFQLFQQGYVTSATLIKMAFVYEGLNDTPKALFFLWQYYLHTEDDKVYEKIQVLSNAYNLNGFELTDFERIMIWVNNRIHFISLFLLAGGFMGLVVMFILHCKKQSSLKVAFGVLSVFMLALQLIIFNFGHPAKKGIVTNQTYLMNGPSAAANLLTVLKEGNQFDIKGNHDVWVQVNWNDKAGYIKRNDLLMY